VTIKVTLVGDGHKKLERAARTLGENRAKRAYSLAINDVGAKAATATGRAIPGQTGLSSATGRRAVAKRTRSTPGTLSYTIHTRGGDVALKYFKAREVRKGTSAAPWNKRQVFKGKFMRAGWWPNRVNKPNWNGHVMERVGAGRWPIKVADSGLYIPEEVLKGSIAEAFQSKAAEVQPRAEHIIRQITKGVVS